MGRVLVTSMTEAQEAVFAKQNIEVIQEISEQAFAEVVVDYLDRHNVLHLATCCNNEPRSTALEYCNDGLQVYVFSEGGGKIANLMSNPQVSYTICDAYFPLVDFFGAEGLQVWGKAYLFRRNENPKRFEEIWQHSAYAQNPAALEKQGLGSAAARANLYAITIEPRKIRYTCARKGYRGVTWTLGDATPS